MNNTSISQPIEPSSFKDSPYRHTRNMSRKKLIGEENEDDDNIMITDESYLEIEQDKRKEMTL